ncbi:hypothetical protein D3C77_418970 [compost metagenome]
MIPNKDSELLPSHWAGRKLMVDKRLILNMDLVDINPLGLIGVYIFFEIERVSI